MSKLLSFIFLKKFFNKLLKSKWHKQHFYQLLNLLLPIQLNSRMKLCLKWYWSAIQVLENLSFCSGTPKTSFRVGRAQRLAWSSRRITSWWRTIQQWGLKYGTPLARRDTAPSPMHIIDKLLEFCWFMTLRRGKVLSLWKNGWVKYESTPIPKCRSSWLAINQTWQITDKFHTRKVISTLFKKVSSNRKLTILYRN